MIGAGSYQAPGRGRHGTASRVLFLAPLAALLLAASPIRADEGTSVRAGVDSQELAVGETLRYTIEVRGSGLQSVILSAPGGMTNLDLVGGPSTSTSFSFINGTASSSKSYTWFLTPRESGTARIPATEVKVGDKIYRTEAIEVKVSPGGSRAPAPSRPLRGAADAGRDPGVSEVRLESEASAETVYVGQPVVLTTRLLTRFQVVEVSQSPDPTLPGFLLEESESNLTPERVFREGREYQSFVLMKRILTPTTPGRTTVAAEKRTIRIRATDGDPFRSFLMPYTIDLARTTAPITIEVIAPPSQGRPADFSGAVGSFRLEVNADRKEAAVGEGVGLQVIVTGTGSLKTVQSPVIAPNADFRIFDPRVEEKASGTAPRNYTKTWSYVVTPLSPGASSLPTISFSYFDPKAGAYRTLSPPPAPLVVSRAEPGGVPGAGTSGSARREVQALQRDIRFLKTLDGPLRRSSIPLHSRFWVWAILGLSIGIQPAAWYAGRRGGLHALVPGLRRGRARRRALTELARAAQGREDAASVASAASRVLVRFVAERFGVPASGLTYDGIEEELGRRGVGAPLASELRSLFERCDLGRFAPEGQRREEREDLRGLLDGARGLVDRLDREIGRPA